MHVKDVDPLRTMGPSDDCDGTGSLFRGTTVRGLFSDRKPLER